MNIVSIVGEDSKPFSGGAASGGGTPAGTCPWGDLTASGAPALSVDGLTGSWFLAVTTGDTVSHRGTLRVSAGAHGLAVSGDLYRCSAGSTGTPVAHEVLGGKDGAWYPQPRHGDYTQHLRSMGGAVAADAMNAEIRAYAWTPSPASQASDRVGDFSAFADSLLALAPAGSARLNQMVSPVLAGTCVLDGEHADVWAIKTSDLNRGLRLVVHTMAGRAWPDDPAHDRSALEKIYADAGIDMTVIDDPTTVPADADLTRAELDAMLADAVGRYKAGSLWELHLFLVSKMNWSGLDRAGLAGNILGIMFDNLGRQRQGTAVFMDARVVSSISRFDDRIDPTSEGQKLGELPRELLRTTAHEIGHGLGLRHTAQDMQADRGIMNQVQALLRQVDPATGPLYPEIAVLAFDSDDQLKLRHRPDPEVCPGWGNWSVAPKGLALGLQDYPERAHSLDADRILDLRLSIKPANELARTTPLVSVQRTFDLGEPVFLELEIRNVSDKPITVPSAPSPAHSMCEIAILDPGAERRRLVGAAQTMCEGCTLETLAPGETRRHTLQVHTIGEAPLFEAAGDYQIELAIKTEERGWIEAPSVVASIRDPAPGMRQSLTVTGRRPFCDAVALGYINTRRGVYDTDRLLRSTAYPLGVRLTAGVLQVATFAEQRATDGRVRRTPIQPNALRVRQAINALVALGITSEVAVAIAEALDPLNVTNAAVLAALSDPWVADV